MPTLLVNIRVVGADGTPHSSEPPTEHRLYAAVLRVLDSTPLCAWATVTTDFEAHSNIGYFAYSPELHLYLMSHPSSLHCQNLVANPSMAVSVFESTQNWNEPGRGVQFFGNCKQVAEADRPQVEVVYSQRYKTYQAWKANLRGGDPALNYRFYRFIPDRLKILDEPEFGDAMFVVAGIASVS